MTIVTEFPDAELGLEPGLDNLRHPALGPQRPGRAAAPLQLQDPGAGAGAGGRRRGSPGHPERDRDAGGTGSHRDGRGPGTCDD